MSVRFRVPRVASSMKAGTSFLFVLAVSVLLAGCERPPVKTLQIGYRGLGMEQVQNPRLIKKDGNIHVAPEPIPAASQEGPRAKDVYQNVQVLGNLSVGEFARTMVAMTAWVSPNEGCAYCHNLQNLADDSKYTKVVSRRMTQMTQHLNADWKQHVGNTGVTCYTCHRGNVIPANLWFQGAPNPRSAGMLGDDAGQNKAAQSVKLASLPYDPFSEYLGDNKAIPNIRVNGLSALPKGAPAPVSAAGPGVGATLANASTAQGNRQSIKQAEHTYALMMHMSSALGVNCTYCHNSRSFQAWDGPAQRVTAWYGIRLAGELNVNYLTPLTGNFPPARLGPAGDVGKVNCATCHQGLAKPLNGAPMAKDYPGLLAPQATAAPALAAAPPDLPAPDINGLLGRVLFESGKATLDGPGQAVVQSAAAVLAANMAVKVALSGYADRTGSADANLELAKQRAFTVRDALKAGGVAEDRIALKKPEFVVGGTESDARRVEIVAAK